MMTGSYRFPRQEAIVYGRPWGEAVAEELARIGAKRAFVVASSALDAAAGLEEQARTVLGETLAGFATGIRAHSPREDVLAIAAQARAAEADQIVAIGGGSVIDAAKAILLCLATGAADDEALGALSYTRGPKLPAELGVRMIAVPTTLSGAEFTPFAGVTDMRRKTKDGYMHPQMAPRAVVLDPQITVHTPVALWNATGIRSLDHAVEGLCSPSAQPLANAAAIEALRLLPVNLRRVQAEPTDLDARLACQCGVWLSAVGLQAGVMMGASHGIGHALGGVAGVPHGVTSCVMMPHVMRWNAEVCAEQHERIRTAMGEAEAPADAIVRLVADLGLPATLEAAGVRRDQFAAIVEHAMHDPWTLANPRPITDSAVVEYLLEQAW